MDPGFQISMQCQATSGDGCGKSGCVCRMLPSAFWMQEHLSAVRRKWLQRELAPSGVRPSRETPSSP